MKIADLAERANSIADPAERAAARQKVLDLASTIAPRNAKGLASDGRRSYKGQGKFKHGFIPVNQAAKEAKAKGSPIAIKRLNRLFGANKVADDKRKPTREVEKRVKAATGRSGNRTVPFGKRKRDAAKVVVNEKNAGASESANDVAFLRHSNADIKNNSSRSGLKESQKEASKSTRIPARARQNWDDIPENLKTVRNGERYVLAEFAGKGYVTKWVGGVQETKSTALKDRKVMASLTTADASKMSPSALQALVNNPKTSEAAKKVARRALTAHAKEPRRG